MDVIRQAVNDGKPLPLTVLLESMWKYRDEAIRLENRFSEEYDPLAARQARMAAVVVAEKASPYVHPKLANVAIRPEDEDEAEDRKAAARITADSLRGKDVFELSRMFKQIAKGEDLEESLSLTTYENRDGVETLDDRAKDDTTTPNETPPEEPI